MGDVINRRDVQFWRQARLPAPIAVDGMIRDAVQVQMNLVTWTLNIWLYALADAACRVKVMRDGFSREP